MLSDYRCIQRIKHILQSKFSYVELYSRQNSGNKDENFIKIIETVKEIQPLKMQITDYAN